MVYETRRPSVPKQTNLRSINSSPYDASGLMSVPNVRSTNSNLRLISGDRYSDRHFDIHDISYALSMICRWGGHTRTWHSVAEHSVRVCNELSGRDRCFGILHDAAEYIYGDLCSPLKKELPSYCAAISVLQTKIYRYFGLHHDPPETVKIADCKIHDWEYDHYVTVETNAWTSMRARVRFLDTFLANSVILQVSSK